MVELVLNNLELVRGEIAGKEYSPRGLIESLLETLSAGSDKLMKLKISKIDLRSGEVVHHLSETLVRSPNLIALDLSYAGLLPSHLQQISLVLSQQCPTMRSLNLSYNMLCFDNLDHVEKTDERTQSENFMINIREFFYLAKFVNHVNFSGMNF